MDVTLREDQEAIRDLAGRILADRLTPDRLRELDADPDWFARDVWPELARADLLGLCLPDAHGGGGYGVFEACLLLEQVGRSVAPVPFLATVLLGAMPLARFGPATELRDRLLRGVVAGDIVLTAAVTEAGEALPPAVPATTATPEGDRWRLDGDKALVPAAHLAHRILVPARTGEGTSTVFLVDPAAGGVTATRQQLTSREPVSDLHLEGVAVGSDDVVGTVGGGAEVTAWITDLAVAGLCAVQAGVCEAALRLAARYTSERTQFNAPVATFQAVAQRMADAYIDTEAVRLCAWQAAWRLDQDLPAAEALAVAKFWAADGGQRVVHAAQHVHGGIGVDTDYPLHRCFRWAKAGELALGGATAHLVRLGARLAAEPA